MVDGKNIIGLGAFKSYFGIWFFQGSFLKDPHKLRLNAQEGKTRGMRQIRLTPEEETSEQILREYIREPIRNHKPERRLLHKKSS